MRRANFAPLAVAAGLAASVLSPAAAKVLLTPEEALKLAFPGCEIQRETAYLTEAEVASAGELAGTAIASAVVHPYRARRTQGASEPCGTAYFDTHRVRTLAETVMVAIDPAGGVLRIEVLAFDEPPDYLPRREWYAQFGGHRLAPETELGRGIRPVTGATLTARVTTDAARRALAVHALLAARTAPPLATPPEPRR